MNVIAKLPNFKTLSEAALWIRHNGNVALNAQEQLGIMHRGSQTFTNEKFTELMHALTNPDFKDEEITWARVHSLPKTKGDGGHITVEETEVFYGRMTGVPMRITLTLTGARLEFL